VTSRSLSSSHQVELCTPLFPLTVVLFACRPADAILGPIWISTLSLAAMGAWLVWRYGGWKYNKLALSMYVTNLFFFQVLLVSLSPLLALTIIRYVFARAGLALLVLLHAASFSIFVFHYGRLGDHAVLRDLLLQAITSSLLHATLFLSLEVFHRDRPGCNLVPAATAQPQVCSTDFFAITVCSRVLNNDELP